MYMIDIITKKKMGETLSKDEIEFFVKGYVNGEIPDYQVSTLLMAIYFRGMLEQEIFDLTMAMVHSGEIMDLAAIDGTTIDKHSTGGIGDKITLIVAPIWAATGLIVAKMSGRGLGYTGGTIDKMEAVPQMKVELTNGEFLALAQSQKLAITAQSGNFVPADKLIYALRDATATVDSLPLIAASVMSKKLATGCDVLVLDVKYGQGSFMKTYADAQMLAKAMVKIGVKAKRKVGAILSPMSHPLGYAVGNSLEVLEAIEVLHGGGNKELRDSAIVIAAVGYYISGLIDDLPQCFTKAEESLNDGSAYASFCDFVKGQGGIVPDNDFVKALPSCHSSKEVKATKDGMIVDIDGLTVGRCSMELGAGRKILGDNINYGAGIRLHQQMGDTVKSGDVLATLYSDKGDDVLAASAQAIADAITIDTIAERIISEKTHLIYDDNVIDLSEIFNIYNQTEKEYLT